MKTILAITVPAENTRLLTDAEMRVAAGLDAGDASKDVALRNKEASLTAGIMSECNIAIGAGADPTLFEETVTQTYFHANVPDLVLARRHNVEIESVTLDGNAEDEDDYFVDPESGILSRLCSNRERRWCADKIVVVYTAGFEETPPELKSAISEYMRAVTLEESRDPYVKAEQVEIPNVETRRTELWSGSLPGSSGPAGLMPSTVKSYLTRFRNASAL